MVILFSELLFGRIVQRLDFFVKWELLTPTIYPKASGFVESRVAAHGYSSLAMYNRRSPYTGRDRRLNYKYRSGLYHQESYVRSAILLRVVALYLRAAAVAPGQVSSESSCEQASSRAIV